MVRLWPIRVCARLCERRRLAEFRREVLQLVQQLVAEQASVAMRTADVIILVVDAVVGATDAPKQPLAAALGRLLYLVHLAVLLWWLFDKSSRQRATLALVSLTEQLLPSATLALRVPPVRRFVIAVDGLIREALFGHPVSA